MTLPVNGSSSFSSAYSHLFFCWLNMTNAQYILLTYEKKRDRQIFFPLYRFFRCWMWNGKLFVNHLRMPSTMSTLLYYYREDKDMLHEPEKSANIRFKKKTYTVKTNMDNTSSHLLDIYQQSMYIYTETYTW
jgi:hypothetical protein